MNNPNMTQLSLLDLLARPPRQESWASARLWHQPASVRRRLNSGGCLNSFALYLAEIRNHAGRFALPQRRQKKEMAMAELHESDVMKKRGFAGSTGFGGRQGGRKTLWLVVIVSALLVAFGAFSVLPSFW